MLHCMFTSRPVGLWGTAGAIAGCRATRVRIDEDVSTAAQPPSAVYPRVVAADAGPGVERRPPCGAFKRIPSLSLVGRSSLSLPSGDVAGILGLYAFRIVRRDDRAAMPLRDVSRWRLYDI